MIIIAARRPMPSTEGSTIILRLIGRNGKEKTIKVKRTHFLLSLFIVAMLSLVNAARVNAQEGKGVEVSDVVVITAEVLAINKENRILVFQDRSAVY
jgi:hypothetical protein